MYNGVEPGSQKITRLFCNVFLRAAVILNRLHIRPHARPSPSDDQWPPLGTGAYAPPTHLFSAGRPQASAPTKKQCPAIVPASISVVCYLLSVLCSLEPSPGNPKGRNPLVVGKGVQRETQSKGFLSGASLVTFLAQRKSHSPTPGRGENHPRQGGKTTPGRGEIPPAAGGKNHPRQGGKPPPAGGKNHPRQGRKPPPAGEKTTPGRGINHPRQGEKPTPAGGKTTPAGE